MDAGAAVEPVADASSRCPPPPSCWREDPWHGDAVGLHPGGLSGGGDSRTRTPTASRWPGRPAERHVAVGETVSQLGETAGRSSTPSNTTSSRWAATGNPECSRARRTAPGFSGAHAPQLWSSATRVIGRRRVRFVENATIAGGACPTVASGTSQGYRRTADGSRRNPLRSGPLEEGGRPRWSYP